VGVCEQMCPPRELAKRRRIQDIALLERRDPSIPDTDETLAVKKFARNVRPRAQLHAFYRASSR